MKPQACLTIGGSDSCAGAGIQADLEAFRKADIHGCSAITALTAQNPHYINNIEPVSLPHLEAEIRTIFDYYDVVAVKTGMLFDGERIEWVASLLQELHLDRPLIVDPVFVSSSGVRLLAEDAIEQLKHRLFPLATLITPNLQEAEVLLGREEQDQVEGASALVLRFQTSVLLKGGHGLGNELMDIYCAKDGHVDIFKHQRKDWGQDASHGTGCRLAAMITAAVGRGIALHTAVSLSIKELQNSIVET
ncbi:MAG: bifunctional hydroxymethylpyrimidine kinase/phosphomethylpyrimidine kinase [Mariprofundaceae bacterium]